MKKNNRRIIKKIILIIISLWNIYFITHLIFFTDKFKKPYENVNAYDYIVNNTSDNQSKLLSSEQKYADFQYMVQFLKENYPLGHIDEQIYKINIEKKNIEFLEKVKNTKDDFEFFLVLSQYFSNFKSVHTYLMTPDLEQYDNMRVNNMTNLLENDINRNLIKYWEEYLNNKAKDYSLDNIVTYKFIGDKYFEANNLDGYITHINDDAVQNFIERYNSILSKKYNHENKSYYYDELIFNTDRGEQVLIRLNNGEELCLYISTEYEFAYIYNELNNIRQAELFYIIDEEKRLCYYRIDSFRIKYLNKINRLSKEITEKEDSFDYIIFDIRNNSGGQMPTFVTGILNFFIDEEYTFKTKFFTPFTDYHSLFKNKTINNNIVKDPIKDIKDKDYYYMVDGKIKYGNNKASTIKNMYVMIDEGTASAADTFAAIMKTGKHAILIGQNTAGEGLADTSSIFSLPNSGLLISFMGAYGLNEDSKSNSKYGTAPDYYISQNISDYIIGKNINFSYGSIEQIMSYDTQLKELIENLIQTKQDGENMNIK